MKRLKDKDSNFKGFIFLTGFSVFEKVIAFVYQAVIAAVLGACITTDSYNAASQLFDLIDTTVLGAVVVSVIHKFTAISKEKSEEEGFDFLSNVNSSLTILMTVIALLAFLLARPLSYVIAPGFEENNRDSLVTCIRILSALPPIMVMASVRQALLRQKKRFIAVNSRSLCISVCGLITVIFFSSRYPENAGILCIGYIISNLLFAGILHLEGKKYGRIRYAKPKFNAELKSLLLLAIPTIISKGIVRISLMVDQVIASTAGTGSVTYLNNAQSLYHIVSNLLIVNLCLMLLTDFTNLAVKQDVERIKIKLKTSVSSILLLLIPVTLLTVCFSNEIASIAYERGKFGTEDTKQVSILLLYYALGFIPSLMNSVYTQVLYAFGKTKRAMYNTLIALSTNIVISVLLSRFIGLAGIALGTSISQILSYISYRLSVQKSLPGYKASVDLRFVIKAAIGAAGCGVVVIAVKNMALGAFMSFVLATALSFAVWFALLLLLKEETTLNYAKDFFGKIFKRGRYENEQ